MNVAYKCETQYGANEEAIHQGKYKMIELFKSIHWNSFHAVFRMSSLTKFTLNWWISTADDVADIVVKIIFV